jgi:hypothetical protein
MHKRLQGIWNEKKKMVETGKNIDWSLGEALAYASLLNEGIVVRLSGQDVERGVLCFARLFKTLCLALCSFSLLLILCIRDLQPPSRSSPRPEERTCVASVLCIVLAGHLLSRHALSVEARERKHAVCHQQ